jgi:hypothetical protein
MQYKIRRFLRDKNAFCALGNTTFENISACAKGSCIQISEWMMVS